MAERSTSDLVDAAGLVPDELLNRRATSPVVLWVWETMQWRPDCERWHLLCTLLASVSSEGTPRVEAHLRVLFRYRDDPAGNPPLSRRSYTRWRDGRPDRDAIPSATAIANTFGGWPEAAAAVGQAAAPDVLARRALALGPAFTDEWLVEGLSLWHATHPSQRSYPEYRRFAFAHNHNPERTQPTVAVSRGTFLNHFGSWAATLAAAGIPTEPGSIAANPGVLTYTEQNCIDALGEAAAAYPDRRLTAALYNLHRQARHGLPSIATMLKRFGTWHEALGTAGLISTEHVAVGLRQGGRRIPDDLILRALRDAVAALGPHLSRRRYRAWRQRRIDAGNKPTPPSDQTIVGRHGSWPEAIKQATHQKETSK